MGRVGEKIDLETFLRGIDANKAAELRTVAARIDELARVGAAMGPVEERFRPWAILAGVLFLIGLVLFFMPDLVNRWLALGCLISLPGLCAVYAWKIRERTWADSDIEALNKKWFLPLQGIYFPESDMPAGVAVY